MFRLKVRVGAAHNAGAQDASGSNEVKEKINGDLEGIDDANEDIVFKIQSVAKKLRP